MGQRRHHYELAFEHYLRLRRLAYVSVNEARRALLPEGAPLRVGEEVTEGPRSLKSFDFVLYGRPNNLLVDVKGRQLGRGPAPDGGTAAPRARRGRMECWVTRQDVDSLMIWERLFGEGFRAAFVFIYWCQEQPPEPLFEEIFEFRDRWYALRAVEVRAYAEGMRVRSAKWGTMHLSHAVFERVSASLAAAPSPARPAAITL